MSSVEPIKERGQAEKVSWHRFMKKVLIIGGGFAGLSAGVALARHGCSVTLLEQRRLLGGRAYSIPDGTTGEWVDNGQHALLGGFHETRQFLKTLGTDDLVKYQDRFRIVLADSSGQRPGQGQALFALQEKIHESELRGEDVRFLPVGRCERRAGVGRNRVLHDDV